MNLPTFEAEGRIFIRCLILLIEDGRIEGDFYPVYPPGKNAEEILEWLSERIAS